MPVTMQQLITECRAKVNAKITRRNDLAMQISAERAQPTPKAEMITELRSAQTLLDVEIEEGTSKLRALEAEQRDDERVAELQSRVGATLPAPGAHASRESTIEGAQRGQDHSTAMNRWVRADTGEAAVVLRDQPVVDHDVVKRLANARRGADDSVTGQHGDLGQFVRSLTTSGGSAIIPTIWAAQLIDLARNKAAVLQAGAQIVPMDSKRVEIGRLTGDPAAAFRLEGSLIPESTPTFDNVTLEAKTLSSRVTGTMEWFQDAANADAIVTDALAAAMARTIDLAALYGGTTTGHGTIDLPTPPNPRGILAALEATAPSSILGRSENGTTQTATKYWDEILDLIFTVRDNNEEPNALIWNSKLGREYAKAVDTTGQPLQLPPDVASLQRYTSNQIPSYTAGTMESRATDVFAGDFTQLLVGQRLDITIQVLTERYADTGEIGIIAHWRGDVQPARPRAFAAYTALRGAA